MLEVLQILEGEINLREDTRVAEQARGAVAVEDYGQQAAGLAKTQDELRDRVDKVTQRIRDLPESDANFAKEIALLTKVSGVMTEATGILARPDTGAPAIGAETDAIELLLQSKPFRWRRRGRRFEPGRRRQRHDDRFGAEPGRPRRQRQRGPRLAPRSAATGDTGATLPEKFRGRLGCLLQPAGKEAARIGDEEWYMGYPLKWLLVVLLGLTVVRVNDAAGRLIHPPKPAEEKAAGPADNDDAILKRVEQEYGANFRQIYQDRTAPDAHLGRANEGAAYEKIAADGTTAMKAGARKFADAMNGNGFVGGEFDPRKAIALKRLPNRFGQRCRWINSLDMRRNSRRELPHAGGWW